jgi:S-formylglutathione hydrolase FrmB
MPVAIVLALVCALAALSTAAESGGTWQREIPISGAVGAVTGSGRINVFLPAGYSPTRTPPFKLLIALHGWRGSGADWERNSPLAHYANRRGYVIIAPHMGTTVYERSYFPETLGKYRWGAIPGGRWVGEVVLPYARRHYNVSRSRRGTGVFGLSTGGRGAALVAQYQPQAFGAFAALSADYDITLAPEEKTATFIYGPHRTFPERWRKDNSRFLLEQLKHVPALLIHGALDRVCPVTNSRLFARDLRRKGYDVTYVEDPALGHDWKLWAGYLGALFEFFDAKLR